MEGAVRPEDRRGFIIALAVGVLLIPAVLGSSTTIFNDGDVSWHIATGQWILDHHVIPRTDPFSFAGAGKPWVPIEWLAEVLLAGAHRLAGYSGVAALVTAALMVLHGMVFFNASRWVRMALLPIVAMDFVLIPMMLARPHLLAWPLIALWTWLMLRARERDRSPPLATALLMTFWANLHGSFVMGLFIAAMFGLEALVSSPDRMRALRQWLIFGVLCAGAVCINANGIGGVTHPFHIAGLKTLPLIDEWKPSNPSVTPFFFGVLAVTLALILWKRPRLHPVRWLLLGALLALALFQVRQQAMLAIVAALILPQAFAKSAPRSVERRAVMIAVAGMAALIAVRAFLPITLPENESNPWKLIAAVPRELRPLPVLNGFSMGGPLILAGIRPYIDGRGDVYGDAFISNYARISDGDPAAFAAAVQRWHIRWAILPNRDKGLIGLVDRSPDWRLVARDKVGVIYARKD